MRRFLWFITFVLLIGGATAQTGASPRPAPPQSASKKARSQARVTVKEVQELHDALAAQQKQSEEQRQQLDQLKSQLQQLLDATQQTKASAQKVQGGGQPIETETPTPRGENTPSGGYRTTRYLTERVGYPF